MVLAIIHEIFLITHDFITDFNIAKRFRGLQEFQNQKLKLLATLVI